MKSLGVGKYSKYHINEKQSDKRALRKEMKQCNKYKT